jgi:ferritin-like metal-binding protein YciE
MPQHRTASEDGVATKTKGKNKRSPQQESALMELFVNSLKDMNWAEKQLIKALKKMAKAASSGEVSKAFEDHMMQSETHVERLAEVFELLGKKPTSKKCAAMEGLISEAEELIEETEEGTEVRDVALIAAAQKVEHYEIATYGTLKSLAGTLGLNKAQKILQQTLDEEKQTDYLLTEIAEDYVNEEASEE